MSHLLRLALRSAWNRRWSLGLALSAIAISIALLLGITRLQQDTRQQFAASVAGVDLLIGPRSSDIGLLLSAVFHLGAPPGGMHWESAAAIARHPAVAWSVPLVLGDSHHGFPVVGVGEGFFAHLQQRPGVPLQFADGQPPAGLFEAVVGAEVAAHEGYRVGQAITLTHGSHEFDELEHDDKPFIVTGILARNGGPLDRAVLVSLEAMTAIHLDWHGGAPLPGAHIPAEQVKKFDLQPKSVTALLVGLKQRSTVLAAQREFAALPGEPLQAVLPGVALDALWQMIGVVERLLQAVALLVTVSGLAGLVAVILAGLGERRRELAILRSVGAHPRDLLLLLAFEGWAVLLLGVTAGLALVNLAAWALGGWLQAHLGLAWHPALPSLAEAGLLAAIIVGGGLVSLIPGLRAYRMALADGLTPRL